MFLSILVTMLGSAFAFTQPALMQGVMQHPFITFICMFIPLIMAQRAAREFPKRTVLPAVYPTVVLER